LDQHIISAWLLRAFSSRSGTARVVDVYDKELDAYSEVRVNTFLAETDAHPLAIERDFSKIESNAARAARVLAKRTKRLPSGLYAFVDDADRVQTDGPQPTKVVEGMRFTLTGQQIPSPAIGDRLALAQFMALMYVRAPKLEAAAMDWGATYNDAAQAALDRLMPGARTDLAGDLASLRTRMLRRVRDVAPLIARSNWWLCHAAPGESFVLGDNPLGTTISLGFDDKWRAILNDSSFVLTLPISPAITLVVAPQRILPYSGTEEPRDAGRAINRLTWRSAARYVLGRSKLDLERAVPNEEEVRRSTISVDLDREALAQQAIADVSRAVQEVTVIRPVLRQWAAMVGSWPWWIDCDLTFHIAPYAAEDRWLLRPACAGWR
jgi:hypothetical protein